MYMQAEVQSLHADGSIALHTRSTKYGKVASPFHYFSPLLCVLLSTAAHVTGACL